jgi:hypothetical protein
MELTGHIENGVVVFDGGTPPPEGTRVTVVPEEVRKYPPLPIVKSDHPGSIDLTNQMIHDLFEEEEVESIRRQWDVPT